MSTPLVSISYDTTRDTMQLESTLSSIESRKLQREFEINKIIRTLHVPTNVVLVQYQLRCLHEPITQYGELDMDRRDRLKRALAELIYSKKNIKQLIPDINIPGINQFDSKSDDTNELLTTDKPFLTEGTQPLHDARRNILSYSLQRAKQRVADECKYVQNLQLQCDRETKLLQQSVTNTDLINDIGREQYISSIPSITPLQLLSKQHKSYVQKYNKISLVGTEIGDTRPISAVSICNNTTSTQYSIASTSWSGESKIWSIINSQCKHTHTLRGQHTMSTDIRWHPSALTDNHSSHSVNLATSSFDATVYLWPLINSKSDVPMLETDAGSKLDHDTHMNGTSNTTNTIESIKPLHTLTHHTERCNKLQFHPSGNYLFSTSNDCTWNMYDIATQQLILKQYGHIRPTYGISCHIDGSLLCIGDMSSNCWIWDIRTGRTVMCIVGHAAPILTCDFSNNGKLLCTGSNDNTIKIWDLRRTVHNITNNIDNNSACIATLPAHKHLISNVKFHHTNSEVLYSTSYDGTAKCWSILDSSCINTLQSGVNEKVMGLDISADDKYIVTSTYDRVIRLWADDTIV